MKTYKVTITETLQMEVEVEAESQLDAEQLVQDKWNNSEYILDADHFKDADFHAEQKKRTRDYER